MDQPLPLTAGPTIPVRSGRGLGSEDFGGQAPCNASLPSRLIRLVVVDDHAAVREGLAEILDAQADMVVVGACKSAREGTGVIESKLPHVAVLDYHIPGEDGLALCLRLKSLPQPPRVILFSAFADDRLAVLGVIAGVDAVVSKAAETEELLRAVRAAGQGRRSLRYLSPAGLTINGACLDEADLPILGMLAHEVEPAEIAHRTRHLREVVSSAALGDASATSAQLPRGQHATPGCSAAARSSRTVTAACTAE